MQAPGNRVCVIFMAAWLRYGESLGYAAICRCNPTPYCSPHLALLFRVGRYPSLRHDSALEPQHTAWSKKACLFIKYS